MSTPTFIEGIAQPRGDIPAFFEGVFSESENAQEGALVGALVRNLIETVPPEDLYVFCAEVQEQLAGVIVFSRLRYADSAARVFLLSPVAVATERQGQGIGQALLRHGLEQLRRNGVDFAVTYGDPAFYGRVGFTSVSVDTVPAPQPLSHPHGWLVLRLSDQLRLPLAGPATAVPAFDVPELW